MVILFCQRPCHANRLGWHINCRVRTSEQLPLVTSTGFLFPGCGFLVPSTALLFARRVGQCPGSIAFIALGRWVTEIFHFLRACVSFIALWTQGSLPDLHNPKAWDFHRKISETCWFFRLILLLVLFWFKPLLCRWWRGQSEGDIWSMDFCAATRFYIVDSRYFSPISCMFPIQRRSTTSW